jgi:hypothetical protein
VNEKVGPSFRRREVLVKPLVFLAISVCSFASILQADGQQISAPASLQFPTVQFANPYGYPQTSSADLVLSRADNDDREIVVNALQFQDPSFSTSTTTPFTLKYHQSKTIPINFAPHSSGHFRVILHIVASTIPPIDVVLIADSTCEGTACEPKGPLCRINKSNEKWQELTVPNYFASASPAIDEQRALHERGSDYDLPTTFILKIVGLKDVVTVKPPGSCDDLIHFTRIPKSRLRARFLRSSHVPSVADGSIDGWDIHFEIPGDMSGVTVVGGGYSEFHFDANKEPKLKLTYAGEAIFDGPVRCINATFSTSTLCQVNPGKDRPKINLEVK